MPTPKYIKRLENKYLVSGPAPLGRMLNYIKRIKVGQYKSSIRGPRVSDTENLDDWAVCFMVGLGLIKVPKRKPTLKIQLTEGGEKIYILIKDLPDLIDRQAKSKLDMQIIKRQLRNEHPSIYKLLKEIFLNSDALKNLAIFFKQNNVRQINRQRFYRKYGKIFSISGAGFNRLPSLVQIAEFCDILLENGTTICIYDTNYINNFAISESEEAIRNIVKQEIQTEKIKKRELDFELDEENFLHDISGKILPEREKRLVYLFKRNLKISKRLKKLYKGRCQICNFTFEKENGQNYSESHHIVPLGESGSEEIKNIIIICANCHRQIHYDKVRWKSFGDNFRYVEIDGKLKKAKYKPVHFSAVKETGF